jgi:hypothetical protein
MSLDLHLDALKAIIEAVPGVDRVVTYFRLTPNEKDRNAYYVGSDSKLHPWVLTREATGSEDFGTWERDVHRVIAHHYRAVRENADEELTAQTEIEAVRSALNANRPLGTVGYIKQPVAARTVDWRMWMGALCIHAELLILTEDRDRT